MSNDSESKPESPATPPLPPAHCSAAYFFEVTTRVPDPKDDKKTIRCYMGLVAHHIDQVWEYTKADRADERTEVEAIVRVSPVLAVLPPNS